MPKVYVYGSGAYRERCEVFAEYIIKTGATVRDAAAHFGLSKSTVHKDITEILPEYDPELFLGVRSILDKNKSERHLRGGQATKKRYEYMKKTK